MYSSWSGLTTLTTATAFETYPSVFPSGPSTNISRNFIRQRFEESWRIVIAEGAKGQEFASWPVFEPITVKPFKNRILHGSRERRALVEGGIIEAYVDLNVGEKALWTAFKKVRKKYERHIKAREPLVGGYHNFTSTFSVKQFDLDLLRRFCAWESDESIHTKLKKTFDGGVFSLGSPKAVNSRKADLINFVDPLKIGGPWLSGRPVGRLSNTRKERVRADSADGFRAFKMNTSVPQKHYSNLINFWFPFFWSMGCKHPCEFIRFRLQAHGHVRTAKKVNGELYSSETWTSFAGTLNEYLAYLESSGELGGSQVFRLKVRPSLEDKKRGRSSASRPRTTYSFRELEKARLSIDDCYGNNPSKKRQAYACLFGICTGLRRGNLCGLKGRDLQPDARVPHVVVNDNVVNGWSRGEKGALVLEACTKTTVGEIALPLLQPSTEFAAEVARFLKEHTPADERILECYVTGVSKLWKEICKDCGIKYVHPHGWKHSYATNGGLHLELYRGNVMLFHTCCLHNSMSTTLKYTHQTKEQLLEAFSPESR